MVFLPLMVLFLVIVETNCDGFPSADGFVSDVAGVVARDVDGEHPEPEQVHHAQRRVQNQGENRLLHGKPRSQAQFRANTRGKTHLSVPENYIKVGAWCLI